MEPSQPHPVGFFGELNLDSNLFFYSVSAATLTDRPFKVAQSPSRRLRRESPFSKRVLHFGIGYPVYYIINFPEINMLYKPILRPFPCVFALLNDCPHRDIWFACVG